jgi:hypothetical protein
MAVQKINLGRVVPSISATASIDDSTGTPSVDVTVAGDIDAPVMNFEFHNLKGEAGSASDVDAILESDIEDIVSDLYSLKNSSWEEIDSAGKAGTASSLWKVGDEKTITLTTGEEVTLVIMGFDHDDLADGSGKAPITFGMKNLLATTYPMNSSNTNAGGWDSSLMRSSTMATLLSQLPSDLKSYVKSVSQKATAGSESTTITTSSDKLWLFSEVEIDGTTSSGYASEGTQYDYWKAVSSDDRTGITRKKCLSNGTGSAYSWWLRSPSVNGNYAFRFIGSYGTPGNNYASGNSYGVCFGFCI